MSDSEPDPHAAAVLTLASIPFPAAIIDREGRIAAANPEWLAACPKATPGESVTAVADASLLEGAQAVARGERPRYTAEHGLSDTPQRVTISALPAGALVILQDLQPGSPDPPGSGPGWQSYKMETIGRLLGGVAHDFANLLTLIAGHSDLVLSRIGQKDPIRPELEEIRKAASRGARLTGQLLGFTRGKTSEPRPLDLNVLVSEMQRMLRPIIGENVQFEAALSLNLGRVMADAGQLEQVVMNLILNARDAMPTGGVIRVETANRELGEAAARQHDVPPGPYVILSISDTGHGISPDSMGQVFQPFFTTKERGKGTGLGLSTVRTIVRESGGDIWVSSLPGNSACFTICLPRVQEPVAAVEPAAPRPLAAGSETILLVEDEDDVRRLLSHILGKRGYQVLEASNGEDALRIFQERGEEIHLVLTDMVMPRMTGRQLAESVRELAPEMRIVFMSGYTDDVLVRAQALAPGMSFLQKPLRPDVLAAKVREALDSPSRPFNPR